MMSYPHQSIPGYLVAAPASGSGKTSLTLGLMAALSRRGLQVAPFKVGPDYIDPGHHSAVCGRPSHNLDSWFCTRERVCATFANGCDGADIALTEGVMGIFDGVGGDSEEGSSAQIAKWLGLSVLLVIDARAQARSFAALVKGFAEFDPQLPIAGVIANRVGSDRHVEILQEAMHSVPGLPPFLGALPRSEEIALPERHLGLVTAEELSVDMSTKLADWVEEHLDLEKILGLSSLQAGGRGRLSADKEKTENSYLPPLTNRAGASVRIGVARDRAFCFYYPENLALLEQAGAQLVEFSPLLDSQLPADLDGLYLGGGYPDLYADQLAQNAGLRQQIQGLAEDGLPIYAECGGFMYLCRAIGNWAMCGVFPAQARMLKQRRALGYRQVSLKMKNQLGPVGTTVRGHEFHYSDVEMPETVERCYQLDRRGGEQLAPEGYRYKNVLGSYVHLHFGSNPQVAKNFINYCLCHKPRGQN